MALTARARSHTLVPAVVIVAGLVALATVPLDSTIQYLAVVSVTWAIAAVGLDLFSGFLGQPSFGNAAFFGIGAYVLAIARTRAHLNALVGILIMVVVVVAFASVIGLAITRLKHFSAALVSFFFAYLVGTLIGATALAPLTNAELGFPVLPLRVGEFAIDSETSKLVMCIIGLLAAVVITHNYANSRSGRALRLIKHNEVVASVMGVELTRAKLRAFVYSAVLAGIGGALYSLVVGYISPDLADVNRSITLFAMAAVGGFGSIGGPIIGAVVFTVVPQMLAGAGVNGDILFTVIFLVAVIALPDGIFGGLETAMAVVRSRLGRSKGTGRGEASSGRPRQEPPARSMISPSPNFLEVENLEVGFGGVMALSKAHLDVRSGSIHALVGPNGAGKTTLLNCISKLQSFERGQIRINGRSINGLGPSGVRALGVGRTFQNPSLVPDLTTLENVELGLYSARRWSWARDAIGRPATSRRETEVVARAHEALDLIEFPFARRGLLAADLTLGEQKLVDIARGLAGDVQLLLLDEPTAGLDQDDIERLQKLLVRVTAMGTTILLIAHNIGFVLHTAEIVTVLDAGRILMTGDPTEVISHREVVEVFTGTAEWSRPAGKPVVAEDAGLSG